MRENKQETELKLSKIQLQHVINSHLQGDQGLNELFTMLVNGLMLTRIIHLDKKWFQNHGKVMVTA